MDYRRMTTMAEAGTAKLNDYTAQLYESLMKNMPAIQYTPRSEAQLRDNLETAYKSSYDQSVQNRRQSTRQNRAAIDADAAARGMGASTWVTDAKMRQNDREASDLSTLAANKNSTIAQQLTAALSDQDSNNLAVQQYNASLRANALNNALSAATSMYDKFSAATPSGGGGSSGGGSTGSRRRTGGGDGGDGPTDTGFGSDWKVTELEGKKYDGTVYKTGSKVYTNEKTGKRIVTLRGH